MFPARSSTNSLYEPAVAGAKIDVAVPDAALVIVAPAVKVVVPLGANHTSFEAVPLETMVTAPPPVRLEDAAYTVFSLVGAVVSIVRFKLPDATPRLPAGSVAVATTV